MARKRSTFGRIYRREGRPGYYVRVRLGSKEVTRWAGPDRKTANEFLADLLRKTAREDLLGEKAVASVSFAEFESTLLDHLRARQAPSTVEGSLGRLRVIVDWFGATPIKDVDSGDVEGFLSGLRNGGVLPKARTVSAATANRYMSLLSVAFKLAIQKGLARQNPARGIDRPKEQEKAVPYVSNADVARLMATARDWRFGTLIRVAADTGLRRGEALALEWSDVDLDRACLVVRRSKNGQTRQVELTDAARAAFKRLLEDRAPVPMTGPNLIWPEWAARRPQAVSSRFSTVAKQAGLRLRFHDLRHAFCSRLAQAGVPLPTISELAGHESWLTTRRYARHIPEGATRAAIQAMERNEPEPPAQGHQVAT